MRQLSKFALSILFPTALSLSPPASADSLSDAELLQQSRAAAKQLGKTLLGTLTQSIQAKGVPASLEMCQISAMPLTAGKQPIRGEVRRTALKIRNPENAPDAWETEVLNSFLSRNQQGGPLHKMEHFQRISSDQGPAFRYMKAIPTGPVCLSCHGREISPQVQTLLEQHYPNDQATGFKPGELRGAFSVILPLEQ